MKKFLLLITLLAASMPVIAQQLRFNPSSSTRYNAPAKVEAENQAIISYCGEYKGGIGAGERQTSAAIEVMAGKAAAFVGGKLTTVSIGVGTPCTPTELTIFLTKELGATPFYTETVTIKALDAWNDFTLSTPYIIDGERFFIGYEISPAADDYPIGVDGIAATNNFGNYLAIDGQWANMPDFGLDYNVCIRATIEGVTEPTILASIDKVTVSTPCVKTDTPFSITSTVFNFGATEISSIEATYQLGTMAPIVKTFDFTTPLAVNKSADIKITDASINYEQMDVPVTVTINKVNGQDVTPESASTTINVWNTPLIQITKVVPSLVNAKTGDAFTITSTLKNIGAEKVTKIEATYQIGDLEPTTKSHTLYGGVSTNYTRTFTYPQVTLDKEGLNTPIKVTISKVNDIEITPVTTTGYINISNSSFERIVVVEENTGTWCGYCPRGLVGMEYMAKTYPETFIGIGVHNGDEMAISSYTRYIPASGYPSSNINRRIFGLDPNQANLEKYYNSERESNPAFAKVAINGVEINKEAMTAAITANATFTLDGINEDFYRFSYVVIENKVGPYYQNNYFSGSSSPMGGWESKESTVLTVFDDVARNIVDYYGVEGTIPASFKANTPCEHTHTVSIENVTNLDNLVIAVLLLDTNSGQIINAAKWPANQAGISDIIADTDNSNAPVEYYNLQGLRVVNPEAGQLLIRRQGSQVTKIIVTE